MQFISMDLIGEFHPPTSKNHRYALTVICMLTGYVFYIYKLELQKKSYRLILTKSTLDLEGH